jgi:heme-degrading monooxygenase HmoA
MRTVALAWQIDLREFRRPGWWSMIARIWRGWTRSWDADGYARYLSAKTIPQCRAAPGNRGVYLLRRGDGDRTEFVAITLWDSLAAMRAFTGENGHQPPLPAHDARFLIDGAPTVVHYETIDRPG